MEKELKIHVLIVDDNNINRLLINKVLTRWGTTTDSAENGLQAVEKITANRNYDAVLMDVYMPEMTGIEATQAIRAKDEAYFKQLPIIALTASMLSSERAEIEACGMNDYILKPFDPSALFEKLSAFQKLKEEVKA